MGFYNLLDTHSFNKAGRFKKIQSSLEELPSLYKNCHILKNKMLE